MFAKELEERARRQELRRRASLNSLTPKKSTNTVANADVKNINKKNEERLDEDSNDVLDLLDSDSASGQEVEEDDVDADSIFLRMDEEDRDKSDAEEENQPTLKENHEQATTTPSLSDKQIWTEDANGRSKLPQRTIDESPGSYHDKLLRHEQVGAINAQQLSRARSTTTQYDPQQQLAIEFIRRREQACAWIKSVMDQSSSSRREKEALPTQETFVSALKNGVILCEMMNVITGFQGRASKIVIHRQYPPATRQMKERDNIETFLAECRDIGLDEGSLFETDDLYESSDDNGGGNLGAVLYTLGALARFSVKNKLITSEKMFWRGHGFKNNDFPSRVYSQSEVTKASVALLMMDGDAATPILNFTDKSGKAKRNVQRKDVGPENNDRSVDTEGSTKVEENNFVDHDEETWGSSDDSDDDGDSSTGPSRFTRGNSVNLRDLDESKKDFQKRMELVKRKLIVTQTEIGSTVDTATSGASTKRRPSLTLSPASANHQRGNINDGYTSGDEEAGAPACFGTLENEILVGRNDESTLLSSLFERNSNSAASRGGINGTNSTKKKANLVVSWLLEQGLEEYVAAFQNAGWDNPKTIATLLTEHELLRMGINKRGHILQILSSVPKLRRLTEANNNASFVPNGRISSIESDQKSTVDTLPADLMQLWGELKGLLQSNCENARDNPVATKNIRAVEDVLSATENLLLPKKAGKRPIVFDIGWHSIRVGYAGAERPELIVPSVKAVVKEMFRETTTTNVMANDVLCCEVADEYAEVCRLRSPLRRGIDEISNPQIIEWEDLNRIIEYIYSKLGVDSTLHPVVILEAWPNCPFEDRSRLVQMFFDTYKVPYISLLPQAPLVLASHGLLNGLVLDIGESFARAVPVFDGNVLANASARSPVAGLEVTKQTMRMLTFDGFNFGSFAYADRTDGYQTGKSWLEKRAAGVLKETLGYVSSNIRKSIPLVKAVDAKSLPVHLQPTLQVSSNAEFVNWSKHRFEIMECLFDPSLIRGDQYYAEGSLHDTVLSSVSQLPPAIQRSMYAYVVVTGGTSACPGLPKRLHSEIKKSTNASYDVRVVAPAGRKLSAWLGGSILAARHDFVEQLCVSRDVYCKSGLGATLEHILEMSGLSLEGTSSYTSAVVDDEHKATSTLQQMIKATIHARSGDLSALERYDNIKSTITALKSMTEIFLSNLKEVEECQSQINRVKDQLASSKAKWAAADKVRCKAAASACKARLKRAEKTAANLRKELADQKKMAELLNDDKSLF